MACLWDGITRSFSLTRGGTRSESLQKQIDCGSIQISISIQRADLADASGMLRGCSSVVERSLCMRKAPGSIPGISSQSFCRICRDIKEPLMSARAVENSFIGVVNKNCTKLQIRNDY